MNINDGIFTQPGPDGIFNRGGEPLDADSPPIDSDGTPLRETLVVAYPSPGHMRVARATRHPQTGKVEMHEQYRMPTPEEVELLKKQGVAVGAGSMVTSQTPINPVTILGPTRPGFGGLGETPPPGEKDKKKIPWVTLGLGVAAGAAGFWAVNKWVLPMFEAKPLRSNSRRVDDDDDDDDEDDADDDLEME